MKVFTFKTWLGLVLCLFVSAFAASAFAQQIGVSTAAEVEKTFGKALDFDKPDRTYAHDGFMIQVLYDDAGICQVVVLYKFQHPFTPSEAAKFDQLCLPPGDYSWSSIPASILQPNLAPDVAATSTLLAAFESVHDNTFMLVLEASYFSNSYYCRTYLTGAGVSLAKDREWAPKPPTSPSQKPPTPPSQGKAKKTKI